MRGEGAEKQPELGGEHFLEWPSHRQLSLALVSKAARDRDLDAMMQPAAHQWIQDSCWMILKNIDTCI